MASNTDLDQGGTFRAWIKTYLGPSVGWVWAPLRNQYHITAAGTYDIPLGVNLVTVSVAGAVTVRLPSSIPPASNPGTQPGMPISVVDVGGNAEANNITIEPKSGSGQLIMGLASIPIAVNYGGFSLFPEVASPGGWKNQP